MMTPTAILKHKVKSGETILLESDTYLLTIFIDKKGIFTIHTERKVSE